MPTINHQSPVTNHQSLTTNNQQPAKILIVDDEPFNLDVLEQDLEDLGHIICRAVNGREALDQVEKESPDLILLDIVMPEMDGFETLQHLKEHPDWYLIPVIITSANNDLSSVIQGIELGAADYLAKPINERLLRARLTTCLAQRRVHEQDRILLQKEAELERHRSLSQIVAGVAHELNTPLAVANIATDMIVAHLQDDQVTKSLTANSELTEVYDELKEATLLLDKNIQRTHRLVQTFKQITTRQFDGTAEQVGLRELIVEIVDLFGLNARQANLTIHFVKTLADPPSERESDDGLSDYRWHGHPDSLTQVLLNLLTNIERHAYPDRTGGNIEIGLERNVVAPADSTKHQEFRLTVRDFGHGIKPENIPQLFTPFFTTARGHGGTGLGLAIVYNLVTETLQGQIQVDSQVGKGTTVTILFS